MSRTDELAAFLAAQGWEGAQAVPLAGDASARRYLRLRCGGARAILMDTAPESGLSLTPFVASADWLRGHGFSAPEVLAADAASGLALIEDLGDDLFARLCAAEPAREAALYGAAVDLLAVLQRLPLPDGAWTPPPYDAATLAREARLLVEWYLPVATGGAVPADTAADYDALTEATFAPVLAAAPVVVLRDYHAENLLWLPERRGHAQVGLLDFQDMLAGHPAYDLVSLLEDARRDVAQDLRGEMIARFMAASGAEPEEFIRDAHVLAAQRNLKIMGLFTRLCLRDGKPGYLGLLPRVWAHLKRDLAHPALRPLASWVERHVPAPEAALLARIARRAAGQRSEACVRAIRAESL